ncbi:MAG: 50S ribosomal protein L9 [Alphaproteobacteria bacterium]
MSSTQVILLERIERLGELGDTVSVKPGFARNYLLPQKKALRASKENIAYFEAQKKTIEADNAAKKKEAEKLAKKIDGIKVPVIRQASEAGQLFGSVASRDIAEAVSKESKETITRNMIDLNQSIKTIGLIPVSIQLHPEIKVEVIVNIARSSEEAQIQADTGRALVADAQQAYEDEKAEAPREEEEATDESDVPAEDEKEVAVEA